MHDPLQAITVSITIDRNWQELYEGFWHPAAFPAWASGLSGASLVQDGDCWKADGPEGPVKIWFSDYNPYGVMDHRVDVGNGRIVSVPLRLIANGRGSEVLLTLFRQPGMTEEKWKADVDWVKRDLAALRELAAHKE